MYLEKSPKINIYFDEYDPLSIANKIKFVLLNKNIQRKMIDYGKKG